MLRSLMSFCLSRRPLVLVAYAAFIGTGFAAFLALNVEAYPDPAPPIIEIIAQYPGQSPEEVERYVTIPLEIAVSSTPGLKYIRSNTVYALGFIRLQFEYGRDYYFVRQQTINRLKNAALPTGVQPVISPAGGISEIFRYQLKGPPDMDLIQLKTLQDWVVERKLRTVPGVADVTVLGGKSKEFQAEIDLNRMIAHGLTLPQIITAISAGNSNVGGRTIAIGEQSTTVRARTVVDCSPMAMVLPPTLELPAEIAVMICGRVRPWAIIRLRSISAWNSLVLPPSTVTSATPGTVRSLRSTTQSCSVLSWIMSMSGGPLSW